MRYQFRTESDDELFIVDTMEAKWGRASSILGAPSVAAAEQNMPKYEFVEEGTLVPMGAGRYSLDGRTPKTEGAGAGLSTVQIMAVPFDTYLVIYLLPNVRVKEESFKSNFPEDALKHIRHVTRQPEQDPTVPTAAAVAEPITKEAFLAQAPAPEIRSTEDDSL